MQLNFMSISNQITQNPWKQFGPNNIIHPNDWKVLISYPMTINPVAYKCNFFILKKLKHIIQKCLVSTQSPSVRRMVGSKCDRK